MYNTVLFPTDGSDGASAALDHAVDVARQYEATLHILFVAQTDIGPSGMVDTDHDDVAKSDMTGDQHEEVSSGMTNVERDQATLLEEQGQQVVGQVAQSVGDDVPVETVVLQGNPYEQILDYSDENDADLIVMGTHGRTGVDRYLLGSVTEKVVRTSDVPVLTVRMNA
jgi:nucleotide-binding universal stress UspA family protein